MKPRAARRRPTSGGRGVRESASCGSFYPEAAVYAPDLLEGRNIVVTGGGSGLGAEMARRFAELGAQAGVLAMTRSLAVEWAAYGIRVNAIAPGPVPTEGAFSRLMPDPQMMEMAKSRVPLKRFGTPREIADAAVFLLSDGAAYVTGDCLTVDGGEWLKNGGELSYATDYERDNV